MSAPLAINAAYRVYPAGVAANANTSLAAYDGYYWAPAKEEPQPRSEGPPAPAQEASSGPEEKPPRQNPDLSPKSSSSGVFTLYAPDSATSPNRQLPSPELSSTPPKHAEESAGAKKIKVRTVFSQEQLQILHHRFQNQKYLSPQQIRELASALGLTYKQIKTWFQNQRMKFKRTQKESLWMKRGMCQPQNGYLDINSSYYPGYTISDARNLHSLASAHENYTSNPACVTNQNYNNGHSQIYGSPHNFYPIVSAEEGSFFGKAAEACYSQQAIGYISQQKMNLYHGFPASMEYTTVKMEDGYQFPNGSAAATSTSVLPPYQTPLQTQGPQSSCNS